MPQGHFASRHFPPTSVKQVDILPQYILPQLFFYYITLAYHGHILGIFRAYIGHILCMSWAYIGQMLGIPFLGYILGISRHIVDISWLYLRHTVGIYRAYFIHILGIHQGLLKIYPLCAQYMPIICSRYGRDMPNICTRYAQKMAKICPRYAQDMPQLWKR